MCAGGALGTILDLGRLPLANGLTTEAQLLEPESRYPLVLVFCPECALVQITETLPPEALYRQYVYFSSYSDTMLREARQMAQRMVWSRQLSGKSRVVEIASNDGYLLQFYKQAGIEILGIEPARNVADIAIERGIPTICAFFSRELARELSAQNKQADVIHANNVLAHVADLEGFLGGLVLLLKRNGVIVIEVPYVKDLIESVEFDTIYHEHLYYFSLTALKAVCGRQALAISAVEHLTTHGGSLRIFLEYAPSGVRLHRSVPQMLSDEVRCGLNAFSYYEHLSTKVDRLQECLLEQLRTLKSQGLRIAAYGASAKGATLLNHFGIGRDILDFIVDRNPAKQGLYAPGTHLPIYGVEKLMEAMPDYVLLLTWNFAAEILEQQSEYRRRGGRFIVPIPEVRVIGRDPASTEPRS
jgi:SAM-dependent methyltransferase